MKKTSGSIIGLKYAVYTRIRLGKGLMMLTWILMFNYFGWKITIHGKQALTLTGKQLEV